MPKSNSQQYSAEHKIHSQTPELISHPRAEGLRGEPVFMFGLAHGCKKNRWNKIRWNKIRGVSLRGYST